MAGKEAGLRIRVERELREAFLEACHAQDRHASDVIREFMRYYSARQSDGRQSSLALTEHQDEMIHEVETP